MIPALQLTLSVNVVLWLMVLELPFTVIVQILAGVPAGGGGYLSFPHHSQWLPGSKRVGTMQPERAQTKSRRRGRALHR